VYRRLLFLISLTALPCVTSAQVQAAPDTALSEITARGRTIAAYDQAAWHATDALMALRPDPAAATTMLALPQADGRWRVVFGMLDTTKDTLFAVYEALPTAAPDSFIAHRNRPAQALTGTEVIEARALATAGADFGAPARPYNSYVFPRKAGGFWVYFLPAQTETNSFPHGADVRYQVSADGRSIIDKHPMHRTLLERALPADAVSGIHTVIVEDLPQDSDVFLVLARSPRAPEVISTVHHTYKIELDGSITEVPVNWKRPR